MKIVPTPGALKRLRFEATDEVRRRGQNLADACNAESSWGGYVLHVDTDGDRPRAVVVDISSRGEDDPRGTRLLRKLDSAR